MLRFSGEALAAFGAALHEFRMAGVGSGAVLNICDQPGSQSEGAG